MINILYICTHNRCRSIMSEAIGRQIAGDQFGFFSAGSQPSGEVHPLSLQYLNDAGFDIRGLESQSWEVFADQNIDLVITVCDQAAGESCPLWMGTAQKLHWPLKDPSKLEGSDEIIQSAFMETIVEIQQRVHTLRQVFSESYSIEQTVITLQQGMSVP